MLLRLLIITSAIATLLAACAGGDAAAPTPVGRMPVAPATPPRVGAVGDSIMGTGAIAPNGWVRQYAAAAGADGVTNLAHNGWFSHEILGALRRDRVFRDSVAYADVVG